MSAQGPLHGVPISIKDVVKTFAYSPPTGRRITMGMGRHAMRRWSRCCAKPSQHSAAALDARWTILQHDFARALTLVLMQRRNTLNEGLRQRPDAGAKVPVADYVAVPTLARASCRWECSS